MNKEIVASNTDTQKSEEYQNFEALVRGLFAVSKAELDAQIKKTTEAKKPTTKF